MDVARKLEPKMFLGEVIESCTGSERIVVLNAASQTVYRGYAANFMESSNVSPMRRVKRIGIGMETYRKTDALWDWKHSKELPEQVPIESIPERGVMKRQLKVCWISAGVSSFIAGYLERETIDQYIYIDIDNQHPDSMRFIKDCEKAIGKPIEILKSNYGSVENVIKQFRFINGPYGAKCTQVLKKRVRRVRKEWEYAHSDCELTYVWGFDLNEKHRADRLDEATPDIHNQYPLIERELTKQDAHAMLNMLEIKRPIMYDMGYQNNNCVGCVKGGMGYWNKIRVDFPEIFERMAKLEREVGHSCIKGVFLDELDPNRGRMEDEIMQDCGIMCYLNLN